MIRVQGNFGHFTTVGHSDIPVLEDVEAAVGGGEHLDGDGDGVDLVVVAAFGKAGDLVDKFIDPRAADEEQLPFFGQIHPGKRTRELVGVDRHEPHRVAAKRNVAAEVLDARLGVCRTFDAVLGHLFALHKLGDQAALLGVFDAAAKTVGDVQVSRFVERTAKTRREIRRGFGRDREVVAAFPAEVRRGFVDDLAEPRTLEHPALGRRRRLLIQRRKRIGTELSLIPEQRFDRKTPRPESGAGRAAERIGREFRISNVELRIRKHDVFLCVPASSFGACRASDFGVRFDMRYSTF